mgnify:FL=1|jgi:phosphoglycerol geranylgeranyltransferase
MLVFSKLTKIINEKGAAYIVLIDPDKKNSGSIIEKVEKANISSVDALFIGGSLIMDNELNKRVKQIKLFSKIPLILFPGGVGQLNKHYDAMLFMSLISGRNPHYLIGEQVITAPLVKDLNIETISTGYILIEGGSCSTVEFMSGTRPIPRNKIDVIISHALAGQYLGMKMIYLESGSGAELPISVEVVSAIKETLDIPIIVGGGIKSPEVAHKLVKAGASLVVTGSIIEKDQNLMNEIAHAVHWKNNAC